MHLKREYRSSHLIDGKVVGAGDLLVVSQLVLLLAQGLIHEADLERCVELDQSR